MQGMTVTDPRAAAADAIRAYCGWHVAPVITETIVRDGNGRSTLVLPSRRIVDVLSVKVDGTDVTKTVRWSEAGMLEGMLFPRRFRAVEVTLEHGFEAADAVVGVMERAARRFATDPTLRSQSVGGASVSYFGGGSGLSHLLTVDEMAALEPYRITWGV